MIGLSVGNVLGKYLVGSSSALGFVNLSEVRRSDERDTHPSESVGRILGEFGEFAPVNESCRKLFAIERSA